MKKIVSFLMMVLISIITLVGCGKFEPKLAEYGVIYRDTTDRNPDGSYPVICIDSVKKEENKIVVKTSSPIEQMIYAFDNFLGFKVYDDKGNSTDKISVKLKDESEQGVFYLDVEGMEFEKVKYVEIVSYEISKDNTDGITFEVN